MHYLFPNLNLDWIQDILIQIGSDLRGRADKKSVIPILILSSGFQIQKNWIEILASSCGIENYLLQAQELPDDNIVHTS